MRVDNPQLWSPQTPNLYDVSFTVRVGDRKVARLHAAQRHPLDQGLQRPAASSTASPSTSAASACTRTPRPRASRSTTRAASSCVNEAKALGATMMRTHYPLHPYTHELADRLGMLIWSEIPVYAVKTAVPQGAGRAPAGGQGARAATSRPTRTTRR